MTLAINRQELSKVLNYPNGVPIQDVISTSRQFQRGELPEPLPYDPEKAKQLLEQAGWYDSDGEGVREKDGEIFRFTAIATKEDLRSAIYVQDQLRKVGIRMEIQSLARSLLRERFKRGDFEAIFHFFRNKSGWGYVELFGKHSWIGYRNPEISLLLDLAIKTIDLDKRDRIYLEIMPIFVEDMPCTILLPSVATHIVHRRIKGLKNNMRGDPVYWMEHLWIEEEK